MRLRDLLAKFDGHYPDTTEVEFEMDFGDIYPAQVQAVSADGDVIRVTIEEREDD